MRVATWNIGGGLVSSGKDLVFDKPDLEYFAREIKAIDPDVLCLQEAHYSVGHDQARDIASQVGLKSKLSIPIADSHILQGEKLCLSVLSKYDIHSGEMRYLRNPYLKMDDNGKEVISHDKGFALAWVNMEKKRNVAFLSGHMVPYHHFGRSFTEHEFSDIRNDITSILLNNNLPTVAGVDLNFDDEVDLLPHLFAMGYQTPIGHRVTTPKGKCIDKIFVSRHWEVHDAQVIPGDADHYLCFADVELI